MKKTIYIACFICITFMINASSGIDKPIFTGRDISIRIISNTSEIVKGQLFDVLIDIKNNSAEPIELNNLKHYLVIKNSSTTINNQFKDERKIKIVPFENFKLIVNPLSSINYKIEDKTGLPSLPWYYWPEGEYEYYISYEVGERDHCSNRIPIIIKDIPDSLQESFGDLKENLQNPATLNFNTYKFDKYEALFDKYKNSFYNKEFYSKLLTNRNYYYAIHNKEEAKILRDIALKLCKDYIINYPESETSQNLFLRLIRNYEQNKMVIDDIVISLRKEKSDSYLLQFIDFGLIQLNKSAYDLIKHIEWEEK